ncbi:MAG TPA: DUF2142 domain-containing protein [Lapillicoccus sp.]|nr:DUF2142 domain-containing protein [Lapillicoccus sp.]
MTGRARPLDEERATSGPLLTAAAARRVVAVFVLPYVLLGLVWALANPAMAGPDEDAHLVKALGMTRFDIGTPGPPAADSSDLGEVRNASISRVVEIPVRLDPTGYRCFAFRAEATAACQPSLPSTTDGDVAARTNVGAYPPFLYPVAGAAANLGSDPVSATRLGRLVVLAASTVLLWLACWHLVRWLGSRSLLGLAVLLTPMAVFCFGILNTSALEILGATGMAAVVAVHGRRPEALTYASSQATVLVCGTALVLSRQLGLITLAVLTGLLLLLGGWRTVWSGLRAGRPVTWAAVAAPGLAALAVGGWELRYDHPALLGPWVSPDSLRGFLAQLTQLLQESIGRFGWLDVRPPSAVNLVWFAAALALVVTALVLGDRRDRTVLIAMLLIALVVSYVTYARVFSPIGAGLQGRHVLPILAVVPIWSGVVLAERLRPRVLGIAVRAGAIALPLVVVAGLYLNAMRYAIGLGPDEGPVWFVPAAQWSPPLGWYPWLVLSVTGAVLLGVTWVRVLGEVGVRSGTTR